MNLQQKQYIANWHDSFVEYIEGLIALVGVLMANPNATEKDKRPLGQIKLMLKGKDFYEIERDLAERIIKRDTFDKIERLDKDLVDICIENMAVAPLVKVFLKQLSYSQIERNKQFAIMEMNELHIPIDNIY